jgi:hypothetical protein
MRKSQFTHVIRAAAGITNEKVFVVASQAIPGQHANPPAALLQSPELDLYPARNPDLADLIEGAIGEGSLFHKEFGYFADAVGPETAKLPRCREKRAFHLQNEETQGAMAICPEIHDIAAAKMIAGRPKDTARASVCRADLTGAEFLAAESDRRGGRGRRDPRACPLPHRWHVDPRASGRRGARPLTPRNRAGHHTSRTPFLRIYPSNAASGGQIKGSSKSDHLAGEST